MAPGSTLSLTEMITRNISWVVKAAGAWGLQPYHLPGTIVLKYGSLNLLEPSGPVQACSGIALLLSFQLIIIIIIFIKCNWVSTRWQWLCYMYTEHEIGY